MHTVIGRVEIEDQLGRCLGKGSDELLDQHLVKSHGGLAVHPLLEPAKRRAGSQFRVTLERRLPGQILPQRRVVIEVLVAQRQSVDALPQ